MEMAPPFGEAAFATLPKALEAGRVTEAQLDTAVRRVLEAKLRMGLFEAPYVDLSAAAATLAAPAHRDVAREAAERTAVLLDNADGLLPLSRETGSIAVIGPLADGARDTVGPWVFAQDDSETVTVLAGIRAAVGNATRVDYSPGVTLPARLHKSIFEDDVHPQASRVVVDDDTEIAHAVRLASAAEVAVLVLGEAQVMIGEHASRSSFDLPGRQQELLEAVLATGTPVVLLIMTGRPVDLKGAEPAAKMMIWYPGTRGGEAVANLVFGDAVPGGKLPYAWPRNIGQVPLPYARLRSHKPDWAEERYWNEANGPLYPFGHGLSYTAFSYGGLSLSAERIAPGEVLEVSVEVTNTGQVAGDEVVQLYIHQRYGSASRPVRALKGFERVTLAPGETRVVRFALGPDELRYWSTANRDWVQDETVFDLWVGGDSTAPLTATFEVGR
jgi:beta-glucosidase